jgi:uncharacterized protein YcbK (DUF882 family)
MTLARNHRKLVLVMTFLMLLAASAAAFAEGPTLRRFFYSGDGRLQLASRKNPSTFAGVYRRSDGGYDPQALRAIHRVFDAPFDADKPNLSLRLIEFLDYLQDRLRPGARITITSGYRSPAYNRRVRQGGGLAAKASLHQYGMAADFIMEAVPSRRVWETVKTLGFGGAGYYQGETVHVDVGPARFWDQRTSGVGTGISDDNQLIGLVADYDIYPPESFVRMRFIRMTAFPIGVSAEFTLRRRSATGAILQTYPFRPQFSQCLPGPCPQLADIDQMAAILWRLPAGLPAGNYDIQVRFCKPRWDRMPRSVATAVFEIRQP